MQNNLLLDTLNGKKTAHVPIWIMRQAGRYLPEYMEIRKQNKSFPSMYKNPHLACKVTLQPVQRFGLDAAILFSDILTIPDALGLGLEFKPNIGPIFTSPISSATDIDKLPDIQVAQDLGYVFDAIQLINTELDNTIPLIGFTGSPWTLATYMLEGSANKDFTKVRQMMFNETSVLHRLLAKLTAIIIEYLELQVKAGVKVIQIFDTWGSLLAPNNYAQFSLQYIQQIITSLNQKLGAAKVPTIVFVKNCGNYLDQLLATDASCISIDWTTDIEKSCKIIGNNKVIQGNLDPAILSCSEQVIYQHVTKLLTIASKNNHYIFNLGHGIYPHTNPSKVKFLVDTVHNFSLHN